jgi:DNA-binding FadR family transcriptional regulator
VRVAGRNLTWSIVQDLGTAIVTGRYSDKKPLPVEADLCRQYGASRSVLREAVKTLTAKGLLTARPPQGTRVQPETQWNLLDPDVLGWLLERKFSPELLLRFTEIRLAMEPQAAALASRASPGEHAAIRAGLERMIAAERGEDDPLESDIAFHVAILRASGNPFFAHLPELIETALRFSIRTTNQYKGVRLASIADHRKISDAIVAGDARTAASSMRVLIQEALDLLQHGRRRRAAPHARKRQAARRRNYRSGTVR